jgi:hypothetical protein
MRNKRLRNREATRGGVYSIVYISIRGEKSRKYMTEKGKRRESQVGEKLERDGAEARRLV